MTRCGVRRTKEKTWTLMVVRPGVQPLILPRGLAGELHGLVAQFVKEHEGKDLALEHYYDGRRKG